MEYEMTGVKPMTKGTLHKSIKKAAKVERETDINQMGTSAILIHLGTRHYSFLITVAFIASWVYFFCQKFNIG